MKFLSRAKRFLVFLICSFIFSIAYSPVIAFAAGSTDVAGTVNSAYSSYVKPQIQGVVNGTVLPIVDVILIVSMIITAALSIHSYRKNGNQFQWQFLAGEFCGLVISLSAPKWIWKIF